MARKLVIVGLVAIIALLCMVVQAQSALPKNAGWVTDLAGLLSPQQGQAPGALMEAYRQGRGLSIARLTEDDLEDLIETPMIEDGRCIARSYRVSTFLAMWLVDIGILQFYDESGRMLRRTNLLAEVEPRAAAA